MRKYSHHKVTCKGKKDGRDWKYSFWPFRKAKPSEPKLKQDIPSHYETELAQAGENIIASEGEKWQKLDQSLKPNYCQAVADLKHADKVYARESEEAELANQEFAAAKAKYEALTMPVLDAKWRNFWLFLIAVAEFPLNSMVFRILGAERVETYLISIMICVGIPLIAHQFGQAIKQEYKNKTDIILMITMPVIVLAMLGAISFIRAKYFEAMVSTELLGISLSPTQMTILFIIINVAIFLIAVMISYEGSHPDKNHFHTVIKRYKETLKKLEKEATEAKAAGRMLAQAERNYQRLRQYREKSYRKFVQKIKSIAESAEWLASSYRAANMRVRKDIPPCFKQPVQSSEIPEELLEIDWECSDFTSGAEQ
ncbi:hypothetical protein H8E88_12235 [candidate division KSB1 bacterium]|nr:hypothetical protein [candidate division KSB1 bacterium]